jgi:hypothetical protein
MRICFVPSPFSFQTQVDAALAKALRAVASSFSSVLPASTVAPQGSEDAIPSANTPGDAISAVEVHELIPGSSGSCLFLKLCIWCTYSNKCSELQIAYAHSQPR